MLVQSGQTSDLFPQRIPRDCLAKIISFLANHNDLLNFRLVSQELVTTLKNATYRGQVHSLVAKQMNNQKFWFVRGFLNVTKLDLSHSEITSIAFVHLANLSLQELTLSYCRSVKDGDLFYLKGMPLSLLNLQCCDKITDKGIEHLQSLPLKTINLKYLKITDLALFYFRNMALVSLDLFYCENITDKGIEHLQLQDLQELDIRWCVNITNKSLGLLKISSLRCLDLSHSNGIDPENRKMWDKDALKNYRNLASAS